MPGRWGRWRANGRTRGCTGKHSTSSGRRLPATHATGGSSPTRRNSRAPRSRDPAAGLELACRALQLNPWYSPFLWNVLGECLTALGRHDEAHDCHLEAARIHPGDVETHLHLAKSWVTLGDAARGLEAVARGLAADADAMHRHSLLAVQQAAIDQLSRGGTARREAALRRQARAAALGSSSAADPDPA